MKKVSIILPVYNAEKFLTQCLDSMLLQDYTAWELIVVDDGSTDRSEAILQEYKRKSKNITIIRKQNEGVSIARNVGLEHIKGEYVYFVDADDILMPYALSVLVEAIEQSKATFVKSDFIPIDEKGNQVFVNKKHVIRRRYDGRVMNSDKFFRKILMGEYFLWTCLFRRDIIEKYHIRFIPHCRLMEDAAFIVDYLSFSNRNIYKDAYVYRYRKYEGTVSAVKKDYSQDLDMIDAHFSCIINRKQFIDSFLMYINDNKEQMKGSSLYDIKMRVILLFERIIISIKYFILK